MEKYKDPAFLFYPESFLVGVMDMTDEEVGQYIRLMCRQHQKGHLPNSVMEKAFEAVQEKFVQDENGKWYNKRLEKEIEKRAKYTQSRRRNLESRKNDDVAGWIAEIVPEELQEAFMEWAKMRTMIKKPIVTRTAITRHYNHLCKLAKRTEKQKKIVEQSIDRCWASFYELKEEQKPRSHRKFEEEKPIDAVPMPDEVREKADALGIRIGGH